MTQETLSQEERVLLNEISSLREEFSIIRIPINTGNNGLYVSRLFYKAFESGKSVLHFDAVELLIASARASIFTKNDSQFFMDVFKAMDFDLYHGSCDHRDRESVLRDKLYEKKVLDDEDWEYISEYKNCYALIQKKSVTKGLIHLNDMLQENYSFRQRNNKKLIVEALANGINSKDDFALLETFKLGTIAFTQGFLGFSELSLNAKDDLKKAARNAARDASIDLDVPKNEVVLKAEEFLNLLERISYRPEPNKPYILVNSM